MSHVRDDLLGTSTYVHDRTVERLAGLSDDEWAWEPASWCWSVRRIGDTWQPDGSSFPPQVPVLRSIAWLLHHLIDNYGAVRNWTWLGLDPPAPMPPCTGTAAGELERLAVAFDRWRGALESVDDAVLAEKIGPIGTPYHDETRAAFVLHELDEVVHHAAEIALLRDLHRARTVEPPAMDTVAAAAANSCWARVVELAEAGADVNGTGMTPLHLAVAVGAAEVVRVLLAHGADTTAKDPQYDMTPKQWAEHFRHNDIVALFS